MRKYLAALFLALSLVPAFAQPPPVPALPDTERRTSYLLSSSTCACSVGFALYGDSTDYANWLEVYLTTGSGATAVTTKLTAVTDYVLSSATGALATIPRPITNGVVTLSTARTGTLQIVGSRRPRRLSQFAENRGVAARDLNQALTDIIATQRETWDRTNDITGRALLTNPGETIGALPSVAARSGGILAFDSSGNPIAQAVLTGLGNVVGPNTSVVGHIATFGNTAGTILLDGGLIGAGNVIGPSPSVSTTDHAVTWKDGGGINIKDSGLTLTPSTGVFTLTNGKTIAVTNTLTLGGTDGSTVAFGAGGTVAYVANNLSVFAATTSAQLAGVISDETGTGALVFANTPTLVTPVLGVATATSINKVTLTAPATGSTLTIADGKTLTANSSLTLAGTDAKTLTVSNSGTLAGGDAFTLAIAAGKTLTASNSITLAGVDGKTLTLNNSGTISGGDAFTLSIAAAKTLTVSNTLTFTGTDGTSFAFPGTSDTVTANAAIQTLTNKTLTAPVINAGTIAALTSFGIRSSGTGAFDLTLNNTENLTAGRTLTLTVNNASRTISLSGNVTTAADFITSGANALTLTTTGTTNVTLPISGTLATRDTSNTFSAVNTFSALNQFTDIKFSSGKLYPTSDGTTALQVTKADGTTRIVNFDTTNARVGINKTAGAFDLDVNGAANVGGVLTFGTLSSTSLGASTSTITGLTVNNSPSSSNDYFLYYSAADGAIRKCTVGACSSAAAAGVSSLNGLTGGLSIVAGTGSVISAAGTSVTVGLSTARATLPTYQSCTSGLTCNGSAQTYTTPSNVLYLSVRACGAGGGGGGITGTGGTGGTMTFGSTTAIGGTGGVGAAGNGGGAGGTGGVTSTGTVIARINGGKGHSITAIGASNFGGQGAPSPFAGGGYGAYPTANGGDAPANSCAGGGGTANGATGGSGGGAGEYVEFYVNSPAASYSYTCGSGGTAGTGTNTGGVGGGCNIVIEEHYGT